MKPSRFTGTLLTASGKPRFPPGTPWFRVADPARTAIAVRGKGPAGYLRGVVTAGRLPHNRAGLLPEGPGEVRVLSRHYCDT